MSDCEWCRSGPSCTFEFPNSDDDDESFAPSPEVEENSYPIPLLKSGRVRESEGADAHPPANPPPSSRDAGTVEAVPRCFRDSPETASIARAHRPLVSRPIVYMRIDGIMARALVDSGSEVSVLPLRQVRGRLREGGPRRVNVLGGSSVECSGLVTVPIEIDGVPPLSLQCHVISEIAGDYDALLGFDFIVGVGGVVITSEGVQFLRRSRTRPVRF